MAAVCNPYTSSAARGTLSETTSEITTACIQNLLDFSGPGDLTDG